MTSTEDHAARIASLEAYSKTQHLAISELKSDLRCIRSGVDAIGRDLHAAKMGGRIFIAVAVAVGGAIAWFVNLLTG